MKKYKITIEGTSPLLMNRPSMLIGDISKDKKPLTNDYEGQAKQKLYINPKGKLYQPSTHFMGALIEAGKHKKVVGKGKATYSKICGYAAQIEEFEIPHEIQEWEVFTVLAVNPNTKGRNPLSRPMLKKWKLTFHVVFDDSEIQPSIMKELFDIAGRIVGIGDWRPQKKGPYGKFQVVEWREE